MDILSGLTFPNNGTKVFQEDWNFEQESKAEEIINSRKDSFTSGIVSGGEISTGILNTINIQPIIGYDSSGKRVESPILSNLAIPINSTYKAVIRHKALEVIITQPDATTLTYRNNSYEILFRTGSLVTGDIPLFQITNASGVTTVGSDLREFRKVKDDSLVTKINIAESLRGLIKGRLEYKSENTKIYLPKWNLYDIKGKFIQLKSNLEIDFSLLTNIFRPDGNPISSIIEIQNKHLYLLLSDLGVLSAQIIDNTEMQIGSHSYLDNAKIAEDYYKPSPLIFNPSENGFYKSMKRIIAVLRISNSNSVDFWYELGNGHRFQDVEHLSVGGKFTEIRWKREHPSCYVADGSTVTNMATVAPELFRIYGSNVLPDWSDRFPRSIGLGSGRVLRDVQEDAFQGHQMGVQQNQFPNEIGFNAGSLPGLQIQYVSTVYGGDELIGKFFKSDGVNGIPRVANETRSKNFAEIDEIVRA